MEEESDFRSKKPKMEHVESPRSAPNARLVSAGATPVGNKSVVCSTTRTAVDLTDDAWLHVFSYLNVRNRITIAAVGRRWRELARLTWNSVTRLSHREMRQVAPPLQAASQERSHVLLEACLQQCGPRLKRLDYSDDTWWHIPITFRLLDLLGRHSNTLRELDLSHSDVDNTGLTLLAERLPELKELVLISCADVDDNGVKSTFEKLQSLYSFSVGYNQKITGECFQNAPVSLSEIYVRSCRHLTNRGVQLLMERCPKLKAIELSGCSNLSEKSFRCLVKNYPKLKVLHVGDSMNWRESILMKFCNLSLLENLDVCGCHISNKFIRELSKGCPHIHTLSFWNAELELTSEGFSSFSSWRHLKRINLGNSNLTDDGLIQISSVCRSLSEVNLSSCYSVSDEGVGHLVLNHPNLQRLDLYDCILVTWEVLPDLKLSLKQRQNSLLLHIDITASALAYSEQVGILKSNPKCIVIDYDSDDLL